jgi:phosphatidate cytidylyltransferase
MILGFMAVLWAGHIYIIGLVLLTNIGIFKEIVGLKRNYEKEINVRYSPLINWYFFAIATFFCYGKLFQSKLQEYAFKHHMLSFVLKYHNIITFMLWVAGFLVFTLSLKKGYYRY